jgi:hypothetical protein
MPSIAMLMTMNAKWYHREMENILVKAISYERDANEKRKIPVSSLVFAI